ncbi:hypothetical protein EDB83DRAFT_2321506 [Lactarius deliciosus]|nr:hypothetical protein EDB83DRAFT_2321506 [Lactarius deliciosus]
MSCHLHGRMANGRNNSEDTESTTNILLDCRTSSVDPAWEMAKDLWPYDPEKRPPMNLGLIPGILPGRSQMGNGQGLVAIRPRKVAANEPGLDPRSKPLMIHLADPGAKRKRTDKRRASTTKEDDDCQLNEDKIATKILAMEIQKRPIVVEIFPVEDEAFLGAWEGRYSLPTASIPSIVLLRGSGEKVISLHLSICSRLLLDQLAAAPVRVVSIKHEQHNVCLVDDLAQCAGRRCEVSRIVLRDENRLHTVRAKDGSPQQGPQYQDVGMNERRWWSSAAYFHRANRIGMVAVHQS